MQSVVRTDIKSHFVWHLFTMYSDPSTAIGSLVENIERADEQKMHNGSSALYLCMFVVNVDTEMCVLRSVVNLICMFSLSWAYMSIMQFNIEQLSSLSVQAQSALVVLSQAASNYGLKLVQLTGELISHCYQALTFTKWTQGELWVRNVESVCFGKPRCECLSVCSLRLPAEESGGETVK